MNVSINYDAPPTVRRFMDSDARVRCIVGPIGSGKSSGCIMEILRRSCEQAKQADGIRRTRWAVIRNTRPQLQDTTRKTFEQWIVPELGAWKEADFEFHMKFGDVEAEVLFRALDRPQDVKKVLSLEITGAYINEAREIPKEIVDGLQGRVGRYPAIKDGGATWRGIWMDTNPWHTAHWGYELFSKQRPEGFELFEQPSGRAEGAENLENLEEGYYRNLLPGKDAEWILEYVDGQYPSADKGSVYGELLSQLEGRRGVSYFEHPSDGVFVNFDLGVSDATSIWWWRINSEGVPDIIDWYEASGEGMSHYFDVIAQRPWKVEKIWLPHDARQRTFQTGVSTLDQFLTKFGSGKVAIGPEVALESGIAAARWLLEQPIRIHSMRCAEGIRRLKAYRYTWDEQKKIFSKKPLHDWTSHSADSFRYLALVAQMTEQMTRKPPPKPKIELKPFRPTLNDLFREADNERSGW